MRFKTTLALTLSLALLSACAKVQVPDITAYLPDAFQPAMRWDARAEGASWTRRAMAAVAARDDVLAGQVPGDIDGFCPGYAKASLVQRRAFWVGLMSAVAKHESSFNPKASGGKGRYIGLLQISPRTAQNYSCTARTSAALKDGAANLECAVRIFAPHVGRDGMVAGRGNRGMARDWGPMSRASKRAEIAAWTAAQSYCQG